jgi:hypothetical protein
MAKKKQNTTKRVAPKDKISAIEKLTEVASGKVVTIPDDVIINVPISGSFRKAIEQTLHYIMSPMEAEEIIVAMQRIRSGFKDTNPNTVTEKERAIWVLMSIISEINYQAAEQKKTIITEEDVNERMADIIHGINTDTAAEDMANFNKEYKDYKSAREDASDNTDEN